MTLQEFTDHTGFYPDQALYRAIEAYYTNFDGDENEFCKAYKENADGLAEAIQRGVNNIRGWTERGYKLKIDRRTMLLDRMLERLGETLTALNNELERKLCGTNMSQDEYYELLESCTSMDGETHFMGETEAKKLVAEEFGFSPEKIKIVDTAQTYDRDVRLIAEYKRPPLYNSANSNYVRFDVRCVAAVRQYEMVNGELKNIAAV